MEIYDSCVYAINTSDTWPTATALVLTTEYGTTVLCSSSTVTVFVSGGAVTPVRLRRCRFVAARDARSSGSLPLARPAWQWLRAAFLSYG